MTSGEANNTTGTYSKWYAQGISIVPLSGKSTLCGLQAAYRAQKIVK